MICNQCGNQILDNSSFCSFCGSKICSNQNNNDLIKYFWSLAQSYLPKKIKFLLIAESPPKNPKNYFYYTEKDKGNYCFFENIILAASDIKYRGDIVEKKKLLDMFCKKGCFLIDAVEITIEDNAEYEILKSKTKLFNRLVKFNNEGKISFDTTIVLIKNLVCELLKTPLEENKNIIFDKSIGVQCVPYPRFFSDPNCYKKLRNIFINEKEKKLVGQ